ncbi:MULTISPECIES: DUF1444 family protein [Gemella]|uniref:DUF1444 family protein n=1 Tax=Gemella TaxID=1378 RepID=UPI00076805A7|nr:MULTISPECIES: DUF1444 family protein [Gemella]AME08842.1 hypothetical protein AXE85_00850 [Gemella sp. oral taxon 928]AXI26411.1 DUF1444 domain-containing protein [Gemella sp. ND 6198]
MSYTRDYILEKILEKLPKIKIYERKLKEKSIFILDYNGHKAKVDIDNFVKRLNNDKTKISDKKFEEFLYHLEQNFISQNKITQNELVKEDSFKKIYPVIRSTGFNKDNKVDLIKFSHTNETAIYLAYDFDTGYKLLDKDILKQLNTNKKTLLEIAESNLEKLPLKFNTDIVAGNTFYFLNAKDGYDGARILDKKVLNYFYDKIGGEYYLGLPHQDVLVIADIKNKKGLEILQKMMIHFFTEGLVPITTITFKYDGSNIESLFIFIE